MRSNQQTVTIRANATSSDVQIPHQIQVRFRNIFALTNSVGRHFLRYHFHHRIATVFGHRVPQLCLHRPSDTIFTLTGRRSKASCLVKPSSAVPKNVLIVHLPPMGFSEIAPVVNVMEFVRSLFVRYLEPSFPTNTAAKERTRDPRMMTLQRSPVVHLGYRSVCLTRSH